MSRLRRRTGAGNALGAALIALAFAALGALIAAALALRPPPVDAETLCRTDAPLGAHTIILVDATDRLEPRHRRKLRTVLAQERARLAQHDRLTLMRLNPRRPQEPAILFSKCLPRPPEHANPLFENARRAQERWDADFANALERALRSAQAGAGARTSPIVASIRAIAADPHFDEDIPSRRVVIVSDLLEHNPQGFSHYADGADFAAWRARSPAGPPDLSQVAVRLSIIDRPEHARRQAAAMTLFWPAFFEAAGAGEALTIDPAP